jgi:hypothetical protein
MGTNVYIWAKQGTEFDSQLQNASLSDKKRVGLGRGA